MTFFKQSETEEQIERIFQRIADLETKKDQRIADLEKDLLALKFEVEHSIPLIKEQNGLMGRIEDLEIWRAKVHGLMIMTNPISKKERLSPIAKKWGEKYSN
jgi:hypothetical protein